MLNMKVNEILCINSRATLARNFLSHTQTNRHFSETVKSCSGHPKTCKFSKNRNLKICTKTIFSFIYIEESENKMNFFDTYEFTDKFKHICWSTILCFILMLNLSSLMFQLKEKWIVWRKGCLNFNILLLKSKKLWIYWWVRLKAYVFNDVFHSEIDGLVIGVPLSPFLCDISMHHFDIKLISIHKFLHRFEYVYDIFALVPSKIVFSTLL